MRKTTCSVLAALAVFAGPVLFAGTASASPSVGSAPTSCVGYTMKLVNGQWVLVPTSSSGCTSSNTGTPGGSGGSGTGTPGTVTNNCPTGGCTGSATGTPGRSR